MILVLIRRYKFMAIRTLSICFFIFVLFASMFLFSVLKINYATSLNYSQRKIQISRDQYNIPQINAPDYRSAMYAWGYVTAEDRIFQMSFRRLLGSGRLSEFLGEKALKVDQIFRELNMRGYSDKTEERLKKQNYEGYLDFQAYTDGINAYANSLTFYPIQYYMLGMSWEAWTISDTFIIYKLLKWSQSNNMGDEYIRSYLLKTMTKEQVDILMPYQTKFWQKEGLITHETIIKDDQITDQMVKNAIPNTVPHLDVVQIDKLIEVGPMEYLDTHNVRGSNSWAISGQHTESGHPILCNDPHLDSALPGQWHQVRIYYQKDGKECSIVGASIVGAPAFIGKTSYIAISLTTVYDDIQDLFKEKIEGDKYFYEGQWRKLKTRRQQIKVKGSEPVVYQIKQTHHGPIIGHIFHRGYIYQIEEGISLTWAGFTDKEYISLVPLSHLAEYQDWQSVQTILPKMIDYGPPMNFLYITKDDHIGYTVVGPNIIRKHPFNGMYVKDGTKSENEWIAFANGKQKLHIEDPKRGYIVTANNKPAGNKFQNGMYETSMQTARADRIQQLIKQNLGKGLKLNKDKMKQFQQDTIDLYCVEAVKGIEKQLQKGDKQFNQLFGVLKGFDCNFTVDSKIGPIFLSLIQNLYQQKYPAVLNKQFTLCYNFGYLYSLYYMLIKTTEQKELGILNKAMSEAWQQMEDFFGSRDVSQFRYGKFHKDKMVHRPFSQVKSLAPFFQLNSEGWGTQNTANVGLMTKLHSKDYSTYHRANIRTILSYWEDSEWIVDAGTSQKFYSRHYNDQTHLFMSNQYLLMDPIQKQQKNQKSDQL